MSEETTEEYTADDGRGTQQRTIEESRANNYPHAERGMTLGTVCEYKRDDWTWVVVTDVLDDGRIRFLNLDEAGDKWVPEFERVDGCVEHAKLARRVARQTDCEYIAPPRLFRVLGPTHPDYQRGADDGA